MHNLAIHLQLTFSRKHYCDLFKGKTRMLSKGDKSELL
jgi:hypothetical protein